MASYHTHYIVHSAKTGRDVEKPDRDSADLCYCRLVNSGLLGTYKLYKVENGVKKLLRSHSTMPAKHSDMDIGVQSNGA